LAVDLLTGALLDELLCLPLIGGETTSRAFCLSAPWQICETLYLLLRVQECRFITPQGAELIVLSIGVGYSLICALDSQTQHHAGKRSRLKMVILISSLILSRTGRVHKKMSGNL
jgi:hypothetical protein